MPEKMAYDKQSDYKPITDKFEGLHKYFYSERRLRHRRVLDAYNLNFDVMVPKGFSSYKPPTARIVVESAVGALKPKEWSMSVPPLKKTDVAIRQAHGLEKFHHHNLTRIDRAYNESPITESIKNGVMYGEGYLKGPFCNLDKWELEPAMLKGLSKKEKEALQNKWDIQLKSGTPFDVSVVDPINVYPDPKVFLGKKPEYIYEHYRLYALDAKATFANWDYEQGMTDYSMVDYVEYWTKDVQLYFIDGFLCKAALNPYGYIPYEPFFAGLGKKSPFGRPEEKAVGLLYPTLNTIYGEAQAMTSLVVSMQYEALIPLTAPKDAKGEKISLIPGVINHTDYEYKKLFEPSHGSTQIILEVLSRMQQYNEMATFGKALAGAKLAGVESGIFEQLIVSQARKRFAPLMSNLQDAWAKVLGKMAFFAETRLQQPIVDDIKPEQINGYYYVDVDFSVGDDFERKAAIDNMNALAGTYDKGTLRETFKPIPNAPDDVAERMVAERVIESPEFTSAVTQKALEKANLLSQPAPAVNIPTQQVGDMGGGGLMPPEEAPPSDVAAETPELGEESERGQPA